MSIINPTSHDAAQPAERAVDSSDVFRELIQHERAICSRCFRRKFIAVPVLTECDDRDQGNREVDQSYVGLVEDDDSPKEAFLRFESSADVEICYPPEGGSELSSADRRACPRARTVCECGAIDADADRKTVSKAAALEHATRISARLEEADVEHDMGELLSAVEEGKSDPDRAGRDEEIFAGAVEEAIVGGEVTHRTEKTELDALVSN